MTAPMIWFVVPFGVALVLWLFQYRERLVYSIGLLCSGLLFLAAWQVPIDEAVELGPLSLHINSAMSVLGRTFTLDSADRSVIALIYLVALLWFAWSRIARVHRYFIPLGLAMVALLVAALAVEPFLYAALLIEIAVLISIPMLSPPGKPAGPATMRYVIFQTLAMPFILFTGWILTGVDAGPAEVGLIVRAGIILGLGFAFLLAVFPFYAWIPLLTEQSHPYVAGFVITTLQTIVLLFGVTFLERYAWLRASPQLYTILLTTGSLMIVTGGVWAAFQYHLGRLLGYAIIVETGFALLAVGSAPQMGMNLFAMLFLPRLIAVGVWAMAISILLAHGRSLDLRTWRGSNKPLRIVLGSLIVAQFSLAGLPVLASFPIKQALIAATGLQSTPLALAVIIGSGGLLLSSIRSLAAFVQQRPTDEPVGAESRREQGVLLLGVLFLVFIGLVPQALLSQTVGLLDAFTHLVW